MLFEHIAEGVEERCFEAGERIVIIWNIRLSKRIFSRITEFGQFIYPRTSRIRQTKYFGTFVERFAGRIINRLTDDLHVIMRLDKHNLTISSGNQKTKERERRMRKTCTVFDKMRQNMSLQMVYIYQRNIQRKSQTFGKGCAYEQRTKQSGTARESNSRQVVFRDSSTLERSIHDR